MSKEFGRILASHRLKKARSAHEFFRPLKKISFSYRTYANFESGKALPSLEQLLEICGALKEEPKELVWDWFLCQLKPALRDQFTQKAPSSPNQSPQINLEQTWVLDKEDIKLLLEPKIHSFLETLLKVYPKAASLPTGIPTKKLKPWLDSGMLSLKGKKVSLRHPYIYIPESIHSFEYKNEQFHNLNKRLMAGLRPKHLQDEGALRVASFGMLDSDQAAQVYAEAEKLKQLFRYLCTEPSNEKKTPFGMSLLLGGLRK